jgi:hypothetical protein
MPTDRKSLKTILRFTCPEAAIPADRQGSAATICRYSSSVNARRVSVVTLPGGADREGHLGGSGIVGRLTDRHDVVAPHRQVERLDSQPNTFNASLPASRRAGPSLIDVMSRHRTDATAPTWLVGGTDIYDEWVARLQDHEGSG